MLSGAGSLDEDVVMGRGRRVAGYGFHIVSGEQLIEIGFKIGTKLLRPCLTACDVVIPYRGDLYLAGIL